MVKYSLKLVSMLVLLAQCTLGFSALADDSIDTLLDVSGIYKQIDGLPDAIKGGMTQAKQQGSPISDVQFQSLLTGIDGVFAQSDIRSQVKAKVKASLSAKEVKTLLVWYQSDLGKEITLAEVQGATAEAYANMQQQAQQLFADTKRVEFAKRYDALIGATDMMLDMQVNTSVAVYSAISAMTNPAAPVSLEQFRSQIAAQMGPMRGNMESMIIVSMVYSYQKVDVEKLNKYETFLKTPEAMKYSKTALTALLSGFEKSIDSWAATLSKNVATK